MIKNIKKIFYVASAVVFGSVFLFNCEPEADSLGEQFFTGINGVEKNYDVIGYNISHNDSIRSDNSTLLSAPLGAFTEGVFGMQKASYVSQVRMSAYDQDFGTNPVIDSVVMVLNPRYHADSATTSTDENYIFSEANIAAKKEIKSYPVMKYGKTKIGGNPTLFNIKVYEVTQFLGGLDTKYFSNDAVAYNPTVIGSKVFDGKVSSAKITKDTDNSVLYSNDVSLRIKMDNGFFQNKIIAHQNSVDLSDAANFIRYFKGVRIAVDETDGYIFQINPANAEIRMYYKNDQTVNGTLTRLQQVFTLPMGVGNAHIGLYDYNRSGTAVASIPTVPNTTGDAKLYPQGMGGPGVGIIIPEATLTELKDKFKNEKIGIISAKIRLYTDEVLWDNKYPKPTAFTILQENATSYMADLTALAGAPNFTMMKAYDLDKNPAYYDFTITKTLKDIVETEAQNKPLIINIGSFVTDSNGQLMGYNRTSRAFTPDRVVLVGSDQDNPKRAQLKIVYGTR